MSKGLYSASLSANLSSSKNDSLFGSSKMTVVASGGGGWHRRPANPFPFGQVRTGAPYPVSCGGSGSGIMKKEDIKL